MKFLEKHNDYLLNLISESVKNDTSMLLISSYLEDKLNKINNPISKRIIEISNKKYYDEYLDNYTITLLDVNDKKDLNGDDVLDSISFFQSNKVIEKIAKEIDIVLEKDKRLNKHQRGIIFNILKNNPYLYINKKTKSETSLGRIVRKLFNDEFKDHEIGEFVEKYKSIDLFNIKNFKLVNGYDIIYWYNEKKYSDGKGPLNDSCMKETRCGEYLKFYAKNKNKVNLLILKDSENEDKIIGRALVWKIDELDGKSVENTYFMDRIYYTKEYIKELFINYATYKSWLYKKYQNIDAEAGIINTKTNEEHEYIVIDNIIDNDTYPYLDTLKYYNGDILTNDIDLIKNPDNDIQMRLEDTRGGSLGFGRYIEFYNDWVDIDDNDDYQYCDWVDDYRHINDCYYSDYYEVDIADDYAEFFMVDCGEFCYDEYDSFRLKNDVFYSKYYNSYIANDFKDKMIKCVYYDYTDENDTYRLKKDMIKIDGRTSTKDYAEKHFKYDTNKKEWFKVGVWSKYYNTYINKENAISVLNKETNEIDWRYPDDDTWYYDENNHKYYSK